jgi:hypothetical protein
LRSPAGDDDGDSYINLTALLIFATSWGRPTGDPGFNPACDFNADGFVDVADLLALARNWGL